MKTTFKAAIFALALTVTVGASAQGYTFTKTLKMGARGADVSALQAVLVSEGHLAVSPTGYFGSMTLKAVKAYQLAKGISPVSGFVGPLTLAKLNSSTVATPSTPSTPSTPVLSGSEGFAEVRLAPTPTNNTNIQTTSDIAVYGIEFKAKQSDISVERINLEVSVNNSGYENPSTLINKITVRDGSTILTTIPVNSSTFSKASSTSNAYFVQITGISTKVAKDTTKTLTVSFDTNSIDTDRAVVVGIYGSTNGQGIRTVDGRGISSYNGLGDTRSHTFNKPGNSNLLVKSDSTTIYSQNYRINTTSNGAEKVLLSTFAVKSETGPSKIISITATTTASGTQPTNLYLYDGSTIIDARSVTSGTVTFDINNSNITVAQDQTKTFTIKADMPATTATSTVVRANVTNVTYEKANGSSVSVASAISGPYHYFAPVVPQFSKVSSTATTIKNNNIDTSVTANVKLGVVAQGGDISGTITASIALKNLATGTIVSQAASSTVTGVLESGITQFADGASRTVDFTATFASTTFSAGTTNVKTFVQSITFTPVGGVAQTLTSGFELLDSDGYASFSK